MYLSQFEVVTKKGEIVLLVNTIVSSGALGYNPGCFHCVRETVTEISLKKNYPTIMGGTLATS